MFVSINLKKYYHTNLLTPIMKKINLIILSLSLWALSITACNNAKDQSNVNDSSYTMEEQLEIARLAAQLDGTVPDLYDFQEGKLPGWTDRVIFKSKDYKKFSMIKYNWISNLEFVTSFAPLLNKNGIDAI